MILKSLIRQSRHSFNIRWECTRLQGRSTLGRKLLIKRRAVGNGKSTSPEKRDNKKDGLGNRRRSIKRNEYCLKFIGARMSSAGKTVTKAKAPNEPKGQYNTTVACAQQHRREPAGHS